MVRTALRTLALLVAALSFAGCAGIDTGVEGDCGARIGRDGVVYRSHNELNQSAPSGESLGTGDVLECDEASVATVEIFSISGVDMAIAIKVEDDSRQGVYVAEDLPPASWPEELRSDREGSEAP